MTYGLIAANANTQLDALTGGYAQWHKGDPGAAGTANVATEFTGRQALTWASASGGVKAITNKPASTGASGDVTITGYSEWTAASGGTCKRTVQLARSVAVAAGGGFTLDSSQVTLGPLAA
jgi:hypothetical protein